MSAQVDADQDRVVVLFTRYAMQSSRTLSGKGSPGVERSRPKVWVNSEESHLQITWILESIRLVESR